MIKEGDKVYHLLHGFGIVTCAELPTMCTVQFDSGFKSSEIKNEDLTL